MAITTYTELQTAVDNWLGRTDLSARTPEFITFAEATMNRRLDTLEMETRATATLATGEEYLALPLDYRGWRELHFEGSPDRILDYLAPAALAQKFATITTGVPRNFTVLDGQFKFGPAADTSYTVEIIYYQKIPALSTSSGSQTNWMLDDNPDLYLFSSLIEAEGYLVNDQRIQLWQSRADRIYAEIEEMNDRNVWGRAPLKMRIQPVDFRINR